MSSQKAGWDTLNIARFDPHGKRICAWGLCGVLGHVASKMYAGCAEETDADPLLRETTMLGNPLTDALILQYRKDGRIRISPFDPGQLDPCAYTLTPDEFAFEELGTGGEPTSCRWSLERDGDRVFPAQEYAVVTVAEQIVLSDGMMGLFVPQSELIEAGFSLTCGKLDPGYGQGGEQIRFGIQNVRSRENVFRAEMSLAHLLFFDVSGSPTLRMELDDREKRLWRRRLRKNLLADAEDDEGLRDLVSGSHQANFE